MKLASGTITFPEEIPYSLKESKEGFVKLLLLNYAEDASDADMQAAQNLARQLENDEHC